MNDFAKRHVFKQEKADALLAEYKDKSVQAHVLQNISKIVGLNYASIKIRAKKQNIKVVRSW